MYESFYGFREKPFSLLPDPAFLYLSAKHSSAYSVLEYGLTGQAGFTVISGEVGSGKTTLVRSFLRQIGEDSTVGLISNTPRSVGSLLRWILFAFDLDYHGKEAVELYEIFTEFLIAEYAAGRRCVLIIDEAQNLEPEMLEELRMLSNVNASKDLLLQVVLVGQPELAETLNRPDLRQFAQRVSISYHLQGLTLEETHAYVRHRLTVAGGDPAIFTAAACDALYYLSRGIPRLINGISDIALVYGFGEGTRQITLDTVLAVYEDRGRDGQWLGTNSLSREQLVTEIRSLEAARENKCARSVADDAPPSRYAGPVVVGSSRRDPRPARAASLEVAGKEAPVSVVSALSNSFASTASGRVVHPGAAAIGVVPKAANVETEPAKAAAPETPLTANAASDGSAQTRPTATRSQAAPVGAQPRPGPREFSPEFSASRRQPAPKTPRRSGRLRWVLAIASLSIFFIGLWLVVAAPRFNL